MHEQPSHSEERERECDGCWQALTDHRRFSVEAARLPRRERGLRERLFITFRDQCVFLWQQAERWDTQPPLSRCTLQLSSPQKADCGRNGGGTHGGR